MSATHILVQPIEPETALSVKAYCGRDIFSSRELAVTDEAATCVECRNRAPKKGVERPL